MEKGLPRIIQDHPMVNVDKWQKMVNLMVKLFDAKCGSITQHVDDDFIVVCRSDNPDNSLLNCDKFSWEADTYCRAIIESNIPLYVSDAPNDERWKDSPPFKQEGVVSYLGFPITWPNGDLFGSICVSDTQSTNYDSILEQVLAQFRDLINADLALISQYEEMRRMSVTDEMTQCYNRRGLVLLEKQESGLAKRFECGLGVVLLDLDNLKLVNDSFGHEYGDKAIVLLAEILRKTARETDIVARIGGDEFVLLVLLNESKTLDALLDRINRCYCDALAPYSQLAQIGISIGSKVYEYGDIPTLNTMLKETDLLMYIDKRKRKEMLVE